MNTSRKIQIALGTIFLWSSTSVSIFAATNTINSGKFQLDTVEFSVESIPSKQLNLTPNTTLVAGQIRDAMMRIPYVPGLFDGFDNIWKNRENRQQRLFDFCRSYGHFPYDRCLDFLMLWFGDAMENRDNFRSRQDWDDFRKIRDEIDKSQQ
ncbi:MAG: hypothetical protein U7127_21190 [Phormidium sp.]